MEVTRSKEYHPSFWKNSHYLEIGYSIYKEILDEKSKNYITYNWRPNVLTYCLFICLRCLLVTVTCNSRPVNMGDQIGGVVWC